HSHRLNTHGRRRVYSCTLKLHLEREGLIGGPEAQRTEGLRPVGGRRKDAHGHKEAVVPGGQDPGGAVWVQECPLLTFQILLRGWDRGPCAPWLGGWLGPKGLGQVEIGHLIGYAIRVEAFRAGRVGKEDNRKLLLGEPQVHGPETAIGRARVPEGL